MAEIKDFLPAKLICGIIAGKEIFFEAAEQELVKLYGPVDLKSEAFPFEYTDYYTREMGPGLKRRFLSFSRLRDPSELSLIKHETNSLEDKLRQFFGASRRVVNLDPGILTPASLIMATAKNFSHRIPLQKGIYGHLEFIFHKGSVKTLEWTYPDFRINLYYPFFLEARKLYLNQLKEARV